MLCLAGFGHYQTVEESQNCTDNSPPVANTRHWQRLVQWPTLALTEDREVVGILSNRIIYIRESWQSLESKLDPFLRATAFGDRSFAKHRLGEGRIATLNHQT